MDISQLLEIKILDKDDESDWNSFVDSADDSSIAHKLGWKNVIETTMPHKTFYLLTRKNKKIVGILPLVHFSNKFIGNKIVSMPFLNHGGVCSESEEIKKSLVKKAIEITKENDIDLLELHHTQNVDMDLSTCEDKVAFYFDVSQDVDNTFQSLHKKVRYKINKAQKNGLRFKMGGCEYLDRFYNIFAYNQRELGTPVFGINFFEKIFDEFKEEMKISLIYYNDIVTAAAIVSVYKNSIEGMWAGSLKKYQNLYINEFLYWKYIEYAIENGLTSIYFGRSSKDAGTYNFKKKFGAIPRQLYWQYYLNNKDSTPLLHPSQLKSKLAVSVWKKLPLFMANLMGPHLRKYLPQ